MSAGEYDRYIFTDSRIKAMRLVSLTSESMGPVAIQKLGPVAIQCKARLLQTKQVTSLRSCHFLDLAA